MYGKLAASVTSFFTVVGGSRIVSTYMSEREAREVREIVPNPLPDSRLPELVIDGSQAQYKAPKPAGNLSGEIVTVRNIPSPSR